MGGGIGAAEAAGEGRKGARAAAVPVGSCMSTTATLVPGPHRARILSQAAAGGRAKEST
ncbi:hypothetical protein [Sinomonas atrocyanea]